jgi:dienelactone hydrolase
LPQASKAFKPDSNNNWWIDEAHFAADFAADIPPEKAAFMAISQVPIVLQELFGVNADIRKHCDELAEQGFLAVAPDLFQVFSPCGDVIVT